MNAFKCKIIGHEIEIGVRVNTIERFGWNWVGFRVDGGVVVEKSCGIDNTKQEDVNKRNARVIHKYVSTLFDSCRFTWFGKLNFRST